MRCPSFKIIISHVLNFLFEGLDILLFFSEVKHFVNGGWTMKHRGENTRNNALDNSCVLNLFEVES